MAGRKKKSYKGKKQYAMYASEMRQVKNFVKKMERHLKKHPEDESAKATLENAKKTGREYKRKKPNVKKWHNKGLKLLAMYERKAKGAIKAGMYQNSKPKKKAKETNTPKLSKKDETSK